MQTHVPIRGTFENPQHIKMMLLVSYSHLYHKIELVEREENLWAMIDFYRQRVLVEAYESSSTSARGEHNRERFLLFYHALYERYDINTQARMALDY